MKVEGLYLDNCGLKTLITRLDCRLEELNKWRRRVDFQVCTNGSIRFADL